MIALASLLLASASSSCLQLQVARSIGEPVAAADVAVVACPEKTPAKALRYDPSTGGNVAVIRLQAGDVIQGASLAAAPTVQRGQRLALSSRVGPVVIERPVTALQASRPGDRQIFVKTDDGEVFAVDVNANGAGSHE